MNFKIIPVYMVLLCSLAPIQSASDNKNSFLSVFAGFQPKASFTNLIGSCNLVKQQAADWYSGLSTPKKCALGAGASVLLAGGLYGGYKWWNRKPAASRSQPISLNRELISKKHTNTASFEQNLRLLVAAAQGTDTYRNILQTAFTELIEDKSIGGNIRIENISHFISCGANPFALDAKGIPLFIHLADETAPQFLFPCLRTKSITDRSRKALRSTTLKEGIKETLVKLLSLDGFQHAFEAIVGFVAPGAYLSGKPRHRAFAESICFTFEDWQEVLHFARMNLANEERWHMLTSFASRAETADDALFKFAQSAYHILTYEERCAEWLERLRAGANPFAEQKNSQFNAFAMFAANGGEFDLLIDLLKVEKEQAGERVRILSDEQIRDGIRDTLLNLNRKCEDLKVEEYSDGILMATQTMNEQLYRDLKATIRTIAEAVRTDRSGIFPESFLEEAGIRLLNNAAGSAPVESCTTKDE